MELYYFLHHKGIMETYDSVMVGYELESFEDALQMLGME